MVPTRRGLFFIGVGVVTYLLAQQSNVGWFYVADAFVWGVLLVNLAMPRWTLWGPEYTGGSAQTVARPGMASSRGTRSKSPFR